MRSAMMLRWICEVPAAMVREKPWTHVLTILGRQVAQPVEPPGASSAASPARPSP